MYITRLQALHGLRVEFLGLWCQKVTKCRCLSYPGEGRVVLSSLNRHSLNWTQLTPSSSNQFGQTSYCLGYMLLEDMQWRWLVEAGEMDLTNDYPQFHYNLHKSCIWIFMLLSFILLLLCIPFLFFCFMAEEGTSTRVTNTSFQVGEGYLTHRRIL